MGERGVKTAVDTVMAEVGPVSEAAEMQLELDEAAARPAAGELWLLPEAARPRGRGRPRGSRNRTTSEMIRLMRARGVPDPLEWLGQLYCRPTAEVAQVMGVKRAEAATLQVRAAVDSLPYWHSKQPVILDPTGAALPVIQIVVGGAAAELKAGAAGGFLIGELVAEKSEENQ